MDESEKKNRKIEERNTRKGFWRWLLLIAAVICCNFFVVRIAIVYGASMEPTLKQYDFVLVWQWNYQPKRGDVVVTTAENGLGQSIIKRVAAVEGQTVTYEQDGRTVELIIPKGQVFLIGDNGSQSVDSRKLGCFDIEEIRGRVILRIFPFTKIACFC